jgi:hypothetical protein
MMVCCALLYWSDIGLLTASASERIGTRRLERGEAESPSDRYHPPTYLFQGRVRFPTGGESPRTPIGADPVELRGRR